MKREQILINSGFIRLDAALKLSGAAVTGGQAKAAVQEGRVLVNGEQCLMRGKKLRDGDVFSYSGMEFEVKEQCL